jgi:hypothetical protein
MKKKRAEREVEQGGGARKRAKREDGEPRRLMVLCHAALCQLLGEPRGGGAAITTVEDCMRASLVHLETPLEVLRKKAALHNFPALRDDALELTLLRLVLYDLVAEELARRRCDQDWQRAQMRHYCFAASKVYFDETDRLQLLRRRVHDIERCAGEAMRAYLAGRGAAEPRLPVDDGGAVEARAALEVEFTVVIPDEPLFVFVPDKQ